MCGRFVGTRQYMTPGLPGESQNLPFKHLENYLYNHCIYLEAELNILHSILQSWFHSALYAYATSHVSMGTQ